MGHEVEYGREPDVRKTDKHGGEEAVWMRGDRAVSVFTSPDGKVTVRLLFRVFRGDEPCWFGDPDGVFDGSKPRVKAQAWRWLEGGTWPAG